MRFSGAVVIYTLYIGALGFEYDTKDSPYILESESLPENLNFMPNLGNGHLGFTLFGDSIFVNGVYNGKGGLSHRARIPNVGNVTVIPIGTEGYTRSSYKLDMYSCIFERKHSNSEITTTIRTYPHRYFNRAIINEIFVQRNNGTSGSNKSIELYIDISPGGTSDDFIPLSVARNLEDKTVVFCEQTREMEDPTLQTVKPYICIATQISSTHIQLLPNETSFYHRIVAAIGETSVVATKELYDVLPHSEEELLQSHYEEWSAFWRQFHITVNDDLELSRTINAGIFYLANSMPSRRTNQMNNPFYGLSPTGLARGNLENDYQGHNFWDTEIWMLPTVTQMLPNWTRELLRYRFKKLPGALVHAKETGYAGARFPWESALTGSEVTNPNFPEIAKQQIHITADIAFAIRHYFTVTNDSQWMEKEGCELAMNIAQFWISRVSLDNNTGLYDIKDVMGPDEDHENVTNNVYTNVVASQALQFVHQTQTLCRMRKPFADKCLNIAEKLKIPYDEKLDYHPQYDGYIPGTEIKQADAVLLSYPLLHPMKRSTLSNNLRIYENVTRASGPAMTWSMHAIGHLEEQNEIKAQVFFNKGYKNYVKEPFKVWSETVESTNSAVNFLTGVGGFLQAIINGYGGVRFYSNRMEVRRPIFLPGTKSSIISGLKYQGSLFTLKLSEKPSITLNYLRSFQSLYITNEKNQTKLMLEGIDHYIEGIIYIRAARNY